MDASDVRSEWADRTGEYSPRYYAYYGPNEVSEALLPVLSDRVRTSASILELGCSSGRHLAHLLEHGYQDVAGVEINEDALTVMAEEFPSLADAGTFYAEPIESVVESLDDDAFDVVFSAQTLQHLHGDVDRVFDEIRRIAKSFIITAEIEGADRRGDRETLVRDVDEGLPLTHRNWRTVFERGDFRQTHVEQIDVDTLRVFERQPDR